MKMIIRTTGNEQYIFLLKKGLKYIEMQLWNDAHYAFMEAKELVLDPCEAYFGLMICDYQCQLDDIIKWRSYDIYSNTNYSYAKQTIDESNSEFINFINAFEKEIDSLNKEKGKREEEYHRKTYMSYDFENKTYFCSELLSAIDFFVNYPSPDTDPLILPYKYEYIKALKDKRIGSFHNTSTAYNSGLKFSKELKDYKDTNKLLEEIENQELKRKISGIYSRGIIASDCVLEFNYFETKPDDFIPKVTKLSSALTALSKIPYFKSSFTKKTVKEINNSVYNAILNYLPKFILNERNNIKLTSANKGLKEIVNIKPEYGDTLNPFIQQIDYNLSRNNNKINSSKPDQKESGIKGFFKSLFK